MMAFLHGLRIGVGTAFPLFLLFALIGYLIRINIHRSTPKRVWLGVYLLTLGCCDIVCCFAINLISVFTSWIAMPMLLGHGIAAIAQFIEKDKLPSGPPPTTDHNNSNSIDPKS